MDNKITKKRLNDHLEYDWFKYILILIVSIVVWVFIFGQINGNRDHEESMFFLSCYSFKESSFNETILSKMSTEMDTDVYGKSVTRELNFNKQNVLSKDYGTLLQTQASYSSDIIIVGKKFVGSAVPAVKLTDEFLALVLPAGFVPEFYEYKGEKYGIRVDKLPGIKDLLDFTVPKEQADKDKEKEEDDPSRADTEFYLTFNANSVNIGKWGSNKTKNNNAQMLFAAKLFLAEYM